MCTICDFSVASGKPDLTESTLSSTFQSSSSTRASLEGMPKSLTRPDSGMLEPGLTQSQRPECNTSNIAAVAAGILASAVSTNSKSAAVRCWLSGISSLCNRKTQSIVDNPVASGFPDAMEPTFYPTLL